MQYTSDSIVTLVGLDLITQSPTLYVGDLGSPKSLFQMKKEILDNCADEGKLVDNLLIKIIFFFDDLKERYQCLIIDNGRGIPPGRLNNSFTVPGTSGKYKREGVVSAYAQSAGMYGMGSKAMAGLSKTFCAISSQNSSEGAGLLIVENSNIKKSEVYSDVQLPKGTLVFHEPSTKFFKTVDTFMEGEGFKLLVDYVEWLINIDDKVNAEVYLHKGLIDEKILKKDVKSIYDYFHSVKGDKVVVYKYPNHIDFMRYKLDMDGEILYSDYVEYNKGKIKFKVYSIVDSSFEDMTNTKFISAVNNIPINVYESHQTVIFGNIIKEKICKYCDTPKISAFVKNNYKLPMYLSISVYWDGASFLDLLKTSYRNNEFAGVYYSSLSKIFNKPEYDSKFKDLYELLKQNIDDAYIQFVNKSNSIKSKSKTSIASRIKRFNTFAPCRTTDPEIAELFIAEGDSAGGPLKIKRNKDFQAVWAMQGKPKNSFKHDIEDVMKNPGFKDLTVILGMDPGDSIEKINYKNIFLVADPDRDGLHINAMLVGNLYTINPQILDLGYVYMIIPPEYQLTYKQSHTFIRNQTELFKFKVESVFQFLFEFSIIMSVGSDELKRIQYIEDDVVDFCKMIYILSDAIEATASRLSIDPIILEYFTRYCKYLSPVRIDRLKQLLPYSDITYVEDMNYLILVEDGTDIVVPLDNVVNEITKNILPVYTDYCKELWEPCISLKDNPTFQNVPMMITEIRQLLDSATKDIKINKFKGLGTMDKNLIEPTCLSPMTRKYVRIRSLGDVQLIYDMLGRDVNERKKL